MMRVLVNAVMAVAVLAPVTCGVLWWRDAQSLSNAQAEHAKVMEEWDDALARNARLDQEVLAVMAEYKRLPPGDENNARATALLDRVDELRAQLKIPKADRLIAATRKVQEEAERSRSLNGTWLFRFLFTIACSIVVLCALVFIVGPMDMAENDRRRLGYTK